MLCFTCVTPASFLFFQKEKATLGGFPVHLVMPKRGAFAACRYTRVSIREYLIQEGNVNICLFYPGKCL